MFTKKTKSPICEQCFSAKGMFTFDYSSGEIVCANCGSVIMREKIFKDKEVDWFAGLVPEENRHEFLQKLGFERKQNRRTSMALVVIAIILVSLLVILHVFNDEISIKNILTGVLIILAIALKFRGYYKAEAREKWQKIRPG